MNSFEDKTYFQIQTGFEDGTASNTSEQTWLASWEEEIDIAIGCSGPEGNHKPKNGPSTNDKLFKGMISIRIHS